MPELLSLISVPLNSFYEQVLGPLGHARGQRDAVDHPLPRASRPLRPRRGRVEEPEDGLRALDGDESRLAQLR